MDTLYQVVDRLNELWLKVEGECKGLVLHSTKCQLSTKRDDRNGKIRLFYKDKPIAECKAQEKIDATNELPVFREMLDAYNQALIKKAIAAEEVLKDFLK